MGYHIDSLDICFGTQLMDSLGDIGVFYALKHMASTFKPNPLPIHRDFVSKQLMGTIIN